MRALCLMLMVGGLAACEGDDLVPTDGPIRPGLWKSPDGEVCLYIEPDGTFITGTDSSCYAPGTQDGRSLSVDISDGDCEVMFDTRAEEDIEGGMVVHTQSFYEVEITFTSATTGGGVARDLEKRCAFEFTLDAKN